MDLEQLAKELRLRQSFNRSVSTTVRLSSVLAQQTLRARVERNLTIIHEITEFFKLTPLPL